MSKNFEIRREVVLAATPGQVFAAVTGGTSGWLFPTAQPSPDGTPDEEGNRVVTWEPPNHLLVRTDGADGWFNALEHIIEGEDNGTTVVRYVHSGIFVDDWDTQFDGAGKHTDFYLHSLGQYVRHFAGRPVTYVAADPEGPAARAPGATEVLRKTLGVRAVGDRVLIDVPGLDPVDGEVDYLTEHFIGIRSADALYRFYGRESWGAPVSAAHHLFAADADAEKATNAWQSWINSSYA
ncbi:SRPBCC family protein [Actinokineospora sp.]|uniref:SRPBCC family protein n=1 Tax=Actinokineospora sp. TaxID=1872133 RepID=UPI004037C3DF